MPSLSKKLSNLLVTECSRLQLFSVFLVRDLIFGEARAERQDAVLGYAVARKFH